MAVQPEAQPEAQPEEEQERHGVPGCSFVDLELKVVVQQSAHTLCAFNAGRAHGTTLARKSVFRGCSLAFSKHIRAEWDRRRANASHEQVTVESFEPPDTY